MDMKICKRCNVHKPTSEFTKYSKSKDKLRYWCRSCDCESNSKWDKNNREHINKYRRVKRIMMKHFVWL